MTRTLSRSFALLQLCVFAAAQTTQSPPPLPSADEAFKQQNQVYKAFLEKKLTRCLKSAKIDTQSETRALR